MDWVGLIKFIFGTLGFLSGISIFIIGLIRKEKRLLKNGILVFLITFLILLIILGVEMLITNKF